MKHKKRKAIIEHINERIDELERCGFGRTRMTGDGSAEELEDLLEWLGVPRDPARSLHASQQADENDRKFSFVTHRGLTVTLTAPDVAARVRRQKLIEENSDAFDMEYKHD